MTSRPTSTAASLTLALVALVVSGCGETPAPAAGRLDLQTCLGEALATAGDGSCRGGLMQSAGDGAAGCFVARAGETVDRRVVQWIENRLVPVGDAPSAFESGQRVTSALFFGVECGTLQPDETCAATPGCLLKLGPADQTIAVEGETTIDFTVAGACQIEQGSFATGEAGEPCDGVDNDCDGEIDEDILDTPCSLGTGVCRVAGDRRVCVGGQRECGDANGPIAPGSPEVADATCNNADDDCDGSIDEDINCEACENDQGCPDEDRSQCVAGTCRRCDPNDDAGCMAPQPFCDGETDTCRACDGDEECTGGQVCTIVGCRACDPTRPATCQNPALPVCDPAAYACRGCDADLPNDCPDGQFCSAGRCGECDPSGTDGGGCANPSPICDIRDVECRGCNNGDECSESHPTLPVCRGGACQACALETNDGCFDPMSPICAMVDGALGCVACDDAIADRNCPVGACTDGQCTNCDPATGEGCLVDSPRPYCDPGAGGGGQNAFCRACERSAECPDGRLCDGGRCVACVQGNSDGCLEDDQNPICGAAGACRPCRDDAECNTRPGDRDVCVAGRCEICDAADNDGCEDDALPACRGGRCQTCQNDGECRDPLEPQCLGTGRCALCDPVDNAGCPIDSPICENNGARCRTCRTDDECGDGLICAANGRCQVCDGTEEADNDRYVAHGCSERQPVCFGGTECRGCGQDDQCRGGQCLADGRCKFCNPATYQGCEGDADERVCADLTFECRGCQDDAECGRNGLPGVCDIAAGRCVNCVRRGDLYAGCNDPAAPVCRDVNGRAQCATCLNNDQCITAGRTFCVAGGRCSECTPGQPGNLNQGCNPIGDEPVCDPGAYECTGCANNEECRQIDPNRRLCEGRTRCVQCLASADCNAFGAQPRCGDGTCTACNNDAFCASLNNGRGQCLPNGQCAQCDPDTNDGCGGVAPICDRVTLSCQPCNAGNCPTGNCIAGSCIECNPLEPSTCYFDPAVRGEPGPPVCDPLTLSCVDCENNDECAGNPFGPECVDGRCACDAAGTLCELNSLLPICTGNVCSACTNDNECVDNPYGVRCDRNGGDRGRCF